MGVILFFMVCGILPFEGETIHAISLLVRVKEPEYPTFLSDELRNLLQALLQKDPEKRPTIDQIKDNHWLSNHYKHHRNSFSSLTPTHSSSARASPRRENRVHNGLISKGISLNRSTSSLSDIVVERLVATGRFTVQNKDLFGSPNFDSGREFSSRDSEFIKIAPRPKKQITSASQSPIKTDQFQSDDPKAKMIKRRKRTPTKDLQMNERSNSVQIEDITNDPL